MLNIFADALLIAARIGHRPEHYLPRRDLRRSPREWQDDASLKEADQLRNRGR